MMMNDTKTEEKYERRIKGNNTARLWNMESGSMEHKKF